MEIVAQVPHVWTLFKNADAYYFCVSAHPKRVDGIGIAFQLRAREFSRLPDPQDALDRLARSVWVDWKAFEQRHLGDFIARADVRLAILRCDRQSRRDGTDGRVLVDAASLSRARNGLNGLLDILREERGFVLVAMVSTALAISALFVVPAFAELHAGLDQAPSRPTRIVLASYQGWLLLPAGLLACRVLAPTSRRLRMSMRLGIVVSVTLVLLLIWALYGPLISICGCTLG